MLKPLGILLMLAFLQACNTQEHTGEKKQTPVLHLKATPTTETLDSLRLEFEKISNNNKDENNLILHNTKDLEEFSKENYYKTYRQLNNLYLLNLEFDKVKFYSEKAIQLCKELCLWDEMMLNIAIRTRVHRGQGELDSIEPLLHKNLRFLKENNINTFAELFPIHELTVHYSYDLKNYEKAIKYGELFFAKLKHYDSLNIQNANFKLVKEYRKDVINLELGVSYVKTNKHLDKAFHHLNDAYLSYTKRQDTEKLNRVHKAFIDYYLVTGNKEKLIEHKEKFYQATLDFNKQSSIRLKETNQLKFKILEDEKALTLLKEENKFKSSLAYSSLVLILLLILFQWYLSKLKREKHKVDLELEKQYEFNKFKTSLLVTIAHELRTPLTVILGHIHLLCKSNIDADEIQTHTNKIKKTSAGLLDKMTDIINLIKGDEVENTVYKKIAIQPFLRDLLLEFQVMATIKKIQLVYISSLENNTQITTDPKILGRLINNLIVNAIKYSQSESKIAMMVHIIDNSLTIKIIDQGIGISPEDQEKIFDKFARVSNDSNVSGFGIGLSIAKQSAYLLNGKIEVESELGKGSTFTLTLPYIAISELQQTDENQIVENKKIKNKKLKNEDDTIDTNLSKVLIVEDNIEMCNVYKSIFASKYDCTFAFDGQEGLTILKKKNFDIVISDVMMPIMDGLELKEKIRNLPNKNTIPFILVTANDKEESKIKAFTIGVDDYITKPFNSNELEARMNVLISNKKAREKWSSINKENDDAGTNSVDERTVQKLHKIVLQHCSDEYFSVHNLASEIGLSQRQLVRVTKKLTGLTPVKFILEIRLLEAYKKIKNKEEPDINNVRFSVGIQSPSYFSTQFKKRFGLSPLELVKFFDGDQIIDIKESYEASNHNDAK